MMTSLCFVMLLLGATDAYTPLESAIVSPGAHARVITLEQALAIVAQEHPEVLASQQDVQASTYAGHAQRAKLLPALVVGDMYNLSHLKLTQSPRLPAEAVGASAGLFAGLIPNYSANIFYATLKQPLMGLVSEGYAWQAASEQARATKDLHQHRLLSIRTDVRMRFASLYKARAMVETAQASQDALQQQAQRANDNLLAGSATQTDVLRLQAAFAAATQSRIAAEADASVEHAYLREALGLADSDEELNFAAPDPYVAQAHPYAPAQLRHMALSGRADLRAGQAQAHGLRLQARARTWALLPSVDLSGTYMNVFADPTSQRGGNVHANVLAAGLSVSWPVWTWGGQWYQRQQAHAQARAAHARLEQSRRQIGAEVAARHANVIASHSAVGVAEAQVAAAGEAYRVMVATLAAEAATTTDLLNAEAGQTQARNALILARFNATIAQLALDQALGADASGVTLPAR